MDEIRYEWWNGAFQHSRIAQDDVLIVDFNDVTGLDDCTWWGSTMFHSQSMNNNNESNYKNKKKKIENPTP